MKQKVQILDKAAVEECWLAMHWVMASMRQDNEAMGWRLLRALRTPELKGPVLALSYSGSLSS